MAVITTESGIKVRTATKSPYVLIGEFEGEAFVAKRSASVATLRTHQGRVQSFGAGHATYGVYEVASGARVR
jgi:trehalose utilization protein